MLSRETIGQMQLNVAGNYGSERQFENKLLGSSEAASKEVLTVDFWSTAGVSKSRYWGTTKRKEPGTVDWSIDRLIDGADYFPNFLFLPQVEWEQFGMDF